MPSIANVVIHVTDIERALRFYSDGLGAGIRFDSGWGSPTPMLALSGTPQGTPLRIIALDLEGAAGLTLCSFKNGDEPASPFEAGGQAHVGFLVDDATATRARLLELGGTALGEPGVVGPPGRRSRLAFIRDPDGTYVELVQRWED